MKIMIPVFIVFVVLFSGQASCEESQKGELKTLFKEALSYEGHRNYEKALEVYKRIIASFPDERLGGEALYRSGFILDEKQNNPPEAVSYYRRYLKSFNGRNVRRAETRLNVISKYEKVDMNLYSEYISILNYNDRNNRQRQIQKMKTFILKTPGYPFLDDALFWYANKKTGGIHRIEKESQQQSVEEALGYYLRILKEFPKSDNRLMVLKKTGDCYRLLGNNKKARTFYNKVYQEGGDRGRILVDKYMLLNTLSVWRAKLLKLCVVMIIFSAGIIIKLTNLKGVSTDSFKTGVMHSLLFIPCASIPVVLMFLLTDPSTVNNTGREPWLLLYIMLVTLVVVFINGVIMKSEDNRKRLNVYLYSPAIFMLHLSVTYCLFYYFNLLSYVERMII